MMPELVREAESIRSAPYTFPDSLVAEMLPELVRVGGALKPRPKCSVSACGRGRNSFPRCHGIASASQVEAGLSGRAGGLRSHGQAGGKQKRNQEQAQENGN